jgi:hypothetical protein
MAKRIDNDTKLQALSDHLQIIARRQEEVFNILGGNSSYGVKGMNADVKDLKTDIANLKIEIEKMKKEERERFSIKFETIPQKIVALVAFLALIFTIIHNFKEIMSK